jgi:protein SEY1
MPLACWSHAGTDGRERGEKNQHLERQTSLFSFALAPVVIINMWTHDIGRYQGANLGLLRIVLELNLQLFQKGRYEHCNTMCAIAACFKRLTSSCVRHHSRSKTKLLFTIRDYDQATPIDDLASTIREDMENIWKDIAKPEGTEKTSFMDFFEIDYAPLPSKSLQADKFEAEVAKLRERYVSTRH